MKNSIIRALKDKKSFKLWAIIFWIALWQIISMFIGQELLVASPVSVVKKLFELIVTSEFWLSILFTFARIMGGFFISLILAVFLGALSSRFSFVHDLLSPLMALMKSTPVASITILILIWISAQNLSLILSIIMVLPIMYSNILTGIQNTNPELLEMADLFKIPFKRRLRYIYIPEVMPYFSAACKISLGISWKSGVAAEVIGRPAGSIGERLYQAKIYLETPDLFAWTLVIVLISIVLEKLLLNIIGIIKRRLEER